ncbi:MAG: carboxypeptidase-like regulatory domain-containing protein, partial [Cyclobacteriaceae bacterium]
MRWIVGLIILLWTQQVYGQSVKGSVKEALSFAPIVGANITVVGADVGTSTDDDGQFELDLDPGRHNLLFSAVGYEGLIVQEVLVKAGKQLALNIQLSSATYELGEVVISANSQNEMDGRSEE